MKTPKTKDPVETAKMYAEVAKTKVSGEAKADSLVFLQTKVGLSKEVASRVLGLSK